MRNLPGVFFGLIAMSMAGSTGAFSFQGQLSNGGNPIAGPVDLEISIFDAASSGNLVDGPVLYTNVALENGRFAVDLTVPSVIFDGSERWVQVRVFDPPGGSGVLLSPRHRVEAVPYAHYAESSTWLGLMDLPAGFADNQDNDLLATLVCPEGNLIKRQSGSWQCANDDSGSGDITGVQAGAGLSGGGDTGEVTLSVQFAGNGSATQAARSDHDHDGSYYGQLQLQTSGAAQVHFDNLTSVPQGLADGDDDALAALSCGEGQIAKFQAGSWVCEDDSQGGGDITAVTAGSGLSGGGATGDVSLAVQFAGSGSNASASRSDHLHSGTYYEIGQLASPGQSSVHYANLAAVPPDLADGDDDALGLLSCAESQIPRYISGNWSCDVDQAADPDVVWAQAGNVGTIPGIDYLGTADAAALVIKTAGYEAIRIDTDQRVGIGTIFPQADLDVFGKIRQTAGPGIHSFSTRIQGDSVLGTGWYILRDETSATDRLLLDQNTGQFILNGTLGVGLSLNFATVAMQSTDLDIALLADSLAGGTVMEALQQGQGFGIISRILDPAGPFPALTGVSEGVGRVGEFAANNPNNNEPAMYAYSAGSGGAVWGSTDGTGDAVVGQNFGTGHAGYFQFNNPSEYGEAVIIRMTGDSGSRALDVYSNWGPAGYFVNSAGYSTITADNFSFGSAYRGVNRGQYHPNCPTCSATFSGYQDGDGWAAYFDGNAINNKGIFVRAGQGQPGLQVAGGTKNAVVETSSGSRALYTEESAEVWFTDYGQGVLSQGYTEVPIDSLFADTVNLSETYHVFLQSYAPNCGQLVVSVRQEDYFAVEEALGGRCEGEFSWRLVARRAGYETTRLEPAPWADQKAGIYREGIDSKSSENGTSNWSGGAGQYPPRKASTLPPTPVMETTSG